MSSDKLNKKAREAAEQYDATYNEEAWENMKVLLDKHMPQQDDKIIIASKKKYRGKVALLLIGLITGALLIYFTLSTFQRPLPENQSVRATPNPSQKHLNKLSGRKATSDVPGVFLQSIKENDEHKYTGSGNSNKKDEKVAKVNLASTNFLSQGNDKKSFTAPLEVPRLIAMQELEKDIVTKQNTGVVMQIPENSSGLVYQKIIGNTRILQFPIYREKIAPDKKSINPENKKIAIKNSGLSRKSFANSFSINFSAGADVSAVSLNNIGKFEFVYGAGVSYTFGRKWLLRTGYYEAKKAYGAKPSDYNPPAEFWNYYPYLKKIDAACKIAEIPIIVGYIIQNKPRYNFSASAGMSSYFMKQETYNYHSINPSGQYQQKSYTINNENKHYFSSLRLSAAFERKFNQRISLITEPYINVPVSGIGYGKVKLNGVGVLMTVNVKPFSKK